MSVGQSVGWSVTLLITCYATRYPALSIRPSVDRSVSQWSVPIIPFGVFFFVFWAYCSCANALVTFSITAPAHPHAIRVAMYPALFQNGSIFFLYYPWLLVPDWGLCMQPCFLLPLSRWLQHWWRRHQGDEHGETQMIKQVKKDGWNLRCRYGSKAKRN